jgi:hypothetical protein
LGITRCTPGRVSRPSYLSMVEFGFSEEFGTPVKCFQFGDAECRVIGSTIDGANFVYGVFLQCFRKDDLSCAGQGYMPCDVKDGGIVS